MDDSNYTRALVEALASGKPDVAAAVLQQHPESARGRGDAGESPLLLALYHREGAIARDIAAHRELDACEAAALGDVARLSAALDADPEGIHARSWDGWTPLHLAAFFGHVDAISLLLDRGADAEARSGNYMSNTSLCAAIAGAGDPASFDVLVRRGARVDARAALGVTPLHLAASRGNDSFVRTLLQNGADAHATMDDGTTPASMARARGHEATAALLER